MSGDDAEDLDCPRSGVDLDFGDLGGGDVDRVGLPHPRDFVETVVVRLEHALECVRKPGCSADPGQLGHRDAILGVRGRRDEPLA